MSGRRSRTVGENDEPQRVRSFQTTRSDSKYFDALPWSAFDNAAPDEVLEQQLSLLEKTDGSNVNSAFLYGNKPSWGWDYVFTFKMPRSLRRCLSSTSSDGSEGSATEKSPVCKAYDPDAVGDNDVEEAADKDKEQVGERVRILARLKSAGFVFSQLLIPSENIILLRFSLPENRLKEKAGKLGIELKLKEQFGGGYMAYSSEREHYFMNDILGKARNSFFCPADRALIILNVLQSKENWGCNLNMEKLLYDKTILQAFALHSEHEHGKLIRDAVWKRWWDPTWKPPLAEMKDYLGGKSSTPGFRFLARLV